MATPRFGCRKRAYRGMQKRDYAFRQERGNAAELHMGQRTTLNTLRRLEIHPRPWVQRVVAETVLRPNYSFLPGVDIRVEGWDHLPQEPVIFAMNHTDRYNYWPFQFALRREYGRYTMTWSKAKNYQNPLTARFLAAANVIPVISKGYLIVADCLFVTGARPSDAAYRHLRDRIDGRLDSDAAPVADGPAQEASAVVGKPETNRSGVDIGGSRREPLAEEADLAKEFFATPRDPFEIGQVMQGGPDGYVAYMQGAYERMMAEVRRLHQQAQAAGLDVLVFPQGTRSLKLSQGQAGFGQLALSMDYPVIPVGCSGSDKLYPGTSPFAKPGRVTYRLGPPVEAEVVARYVPTEPYTPFTINAERRYRENFLGFSQTVLERVDTLLDPDYRFSEDRRSTGVSGTSRFV